MKIKCPWFTIELKAIKRVKKYPPRQSDYCDVCGDKVGTAWKVKHMREKHPAYSFRTNISGKCLCEVCSQIVGTVGNIAAHYRECHPEKITTITEGINQVGQVER
jgi:hypothetical protein